MSAESISVVWPDLCLGCGEKRIGLKDVRYKWRSTEPIGSKKQAFMPMISLKVEVQLCEECAEESKMLRKANTSWDLIIWLMKLFFLVLIPTIMILISIALIPIDPGVNYTYFPRYLVMTYPFLAIFVTFHDARMINLTRSTPASAFITIHPPSFQDNSLSFSFRNEQYSSTFRLQNPALKCVHTPSVGGDIANPKSFPIMKAITILLPSLIAIELIILLVIG